MSNLTDAKSWIVSTNLTSGGQMEFDLGQSSISVGPDTSPVEQLLAAVGACIAKSCEAVMRFHGLDASGLDVRVVGKKPAGPLMGKGLDSIEILIKFEQPLDPAKMERVLADTKKVCTVTNSLSKEIDLVISGASNLAAS